MDFDKDLLAMRKGSDEIIEIEYIDKITIYRNGIIEISKELDEPIIIDLDKLNEFYPRK